MSDLYDKIREAFAFRREWAEKSGLGFVMPSKKFSERGYWTEWTEKNEKHQMFISLQVSDSRRSGAP